MKRRTFVLAATAAALAAGTAATAYAATRPRLTSGFDFDSPDVVAEGLALPWGMDFLPDGAALFNQRDSKQMSRVSPGTAPEVVGTVDDAQPAGEGGLLGLAVSPSYKDDKYVYIYFTAAADNRVARLKLDGFTPEVILDGIPKAEHHNGGRLRFGPDGRLYVTTGDALDRDNPQDPDSLGGKILRLNPDGSVPDDNPTKGSPVYTLGHRNVEGLDWTDGGDLYASELGENTWDEVNHIVAGKNYGWPEVEGTGGEPDYVDPIVTWHTADASPSGSAIVGDIMYVGALRGERLWQVPYGGGDPVAALEGTYGRIRTVEVSPDGWLWIATSNETEDKIVRFPNRP
ncbi:MAG TPA: PQQ-dependent sugar dehydrogenase [Stackebrandtia sp.]|jgi:glucose/arabinose dehydrogenase|uniref:PQQ-dependent sugar dehydrogenase n=1 Tax=Stackebrandtia sp. TaxID=2023065 RepID=UPI002D5375DF|nr:PQQ-dependent sugar dehydrogenase [Stackebrandtia sp.]HZE41654.1 PQQ-dependent sugar dehydrogenase [Stackebrandtia sp.]